MIKQSNLIPVEVFPNVKLTAQLMGDEESFLQIASSVAPRVYYCYEYPEDHEVLITGKTFDEAKGSLQRLIKYLDISEDFSWYIDMDIYPELYSDEEEEPVDEDNQKFSTLDQQLKKEILAHNENVNRESLSVPRRFMMFFIDDGCIIGICKEIKKPELSLAEESLLAILENYRNIIEDNMVHAAQSKIIARNKLKEYLMSDKQFKISSNQSLRDAYAKELWDDKEKRWIQEGFEKTRFGFAPKDYFTFIERVYKEMKYEGLAK